MEKPLQRAGVDYMNCLVCEQPMKHLKLLGPVGHSLWECAEHGEADIRLRNDMTFTVCPRCWAANAGVNGSKSGTLAGVADGRGGYRPGDCQFHGVIPEAEVLAAPVKFRIARPQPHLRPPAANSEDR